MKISGGIGGFLENETFITQHLEGLRDMLLFEDHSVNDVTASCMRDGWAEVRVSMSVISLTYLKALMPWGGDTWLIIDRNMGGPNRVPCGTPA